MAIWAQGPQGLSRLVSYGGCVTSLGGLPVLWRAFGALVTEVEPGEAGEARTSLRGEPRLLELATCAAGPPNARGEPADPGGG